MSRKMTRKVKEKISRLALAGKTVREIAEVVPVGKSTVSSFLRTGEERESNDQEFIALWNGGMAPDAIASRLGFRNVKYVYTKACRLRLSLGAGREKGGRVLIRGGGSLLS